MSRAMLFGLLLFACGCDTLFPEFFKSADMAGGDGGSGDGGGDGTPRIAGAVCALPDARDFRSCQAVRGRGLRVTIEETGESAVTDAQGVFVLPTQRPLALATLSISDPSATFLTTITQVRPRGGVLDPIALPVFDAQTMLLIAQSNGFALDPERGAVIAWATDAMGRPQRGVRATSAPQALGPFSDGTAPNQMVPSQSTSGLGLIAVFDLAPPSVRLSVQPPAPLRADAYDLPIRSGALTITTLTLRAP